MEKPTYESWMKAVDAKVGALVGLSIHDLPDMCFRDEYESGTSPDEMARQAVSEAAEDMGMDDFDF